MPTGWKEAAVFAGIGVAVGVGVAIAARKAADARAEASHGASEEAGDGAGANRPAAGERGHGKPREASAMAATPSDASGGAGGPSGRGGARRGYVPKKSIREIILSRQAEDAKAPEVAPRGTSFDVEADKVESDCTITKVFKLAVPHMGDYLSDDVDAAVENVRWNVVTATGQPIKYRNNIDEQFTILGQIIRHPALGTETYGFVRAGPRSRTWFAPEKVRAAIVTCGGLCPGLNNVIRDIVRSLSTLYGVDQVFGIREGYSGFYLHDPIELTVDSVSDIHHWGGTVLGSSRGGFDLDRITAAVKKAGYNQLYIIGGDGTHRGAHTLYKHFREQGLNISVACVPKTVDNDIAFIDRSFGFTTAVEEAQAAIRSAKTEAKCAPNGIGIVKLMGRSSGYIAAHSTLASGDVDVCLIPEVPTVLEGPDSFLAHVGRVLEKRGHAVIVVAEGVGEQLLLDDATKVEHDASGNIKLPPIAPWLKDRVVAYFKARDTTVNVKVLDPSYMIRSVRANASDSLYCMLLAQNVVHGVMAGYTGFSVALVNNRLVYLPMTSITKNSPAFMDPRGRTWERILSATRQPNTVPERAEKAK